MLAWGRFTCATLSPDSRNCSNSISGVLERNFLSRKDGERLRGRLQFAEAQIAGKAAGLAYKQLTRFLCNGGGPLDDATKTALLC